MTKQKYLLPNGMEDILYPQAGQKRKTINKILDCFEAKGYKEISPPLVEFETSLVNDLFPNINNQTMRMVDPLTTKMVGIRADMTMQIARIANSRLINEKLPLRLCYSGEVLRVKGEGLYKERQLTQAGLELIGENSAETDVEVILMALEALDKIGIVGVCIDLNFPQIIKILLDELDIENKEEMREFLDKKDIASINNDILKQIVQVSGDANTAVEKLKEINLPDSVKPLCERLYKIVDILKNNPIMMIILTVDISETRGFQYYTGISFGIFRHNTELGRGGHYKLNDDIEGVGASLYINEILRG